MAGFPSDPSKIEVGFAFGADLSADPAGLTYTAVTSSVQPEVLIRRGRIGDSVATQPNEIELTVNDPTGVYSPRNIAGANYGKLRRNTPVRVRVDTGSGFVTRGIANLPDWNPEWIGPGMGDRIRLRALGLLGRIGQGRDAFSALYRTMRAAAPSAYWPMEDGSGATQAASGLVGGSSITNIAGYTPAAALSTRAGSDPYANLTISQPNTAAQGPQAATIDLTPFGMSSNRISIGCVLSAAYASTPAPTDIMVAQVTTSTGALVRFTVYAGYSGGARTGTFGLSVVGYSILGENFDPFDGNSHSVLVTWTQNGANLDVSLILDGVTLTATTAATLGTPQTLTLGIAQTGTLDAVTINNDGATLGLGHLIVWSDVNPTDPYQASIGYDGEAAATRVARICAEQGILVDVAAGGSELMGAQLPNTTISLLRECEDSDSATLVDRIAGKLGFDPSISRCDQAAGLTLNYTTQVADLQPFDDDRDLVNDVTVTRVGGSSARYQLTSGPLSISPTTGAGPYPQTPSLSLHTDDQTPNHAHWLVMKGTVDEPRYTLFLNLRSPNNAGLISQWLACDLGSRVVVNNPPSLHTGPAPLDLIIEGYEELIDAVRWEVKLYCLPYRPYEVYQVQSGTGNRSRIPSDGGCTVNAQQSAVTAGTSQSWAVTSTGTRWIDSATYPSQFPMVMVAAGERMTCTAITGTTGSQTMTMTRGLDGVAKVIPAGSVVQLYHPPVTAL